MNQEQQSVKVEVYTSSHCPHCVRAKALLEKKGATFVEINIDHDPTRAEMVNRTGGASSVPQIFINGEFIPGGADGLFERDARGELDTLLQIQ